jgi:hypothetical protein
MKKKVEMSCKGHKEPKGMKEEKHKLEKHGKEKVKSAHKGKK